MNIAPLRTSILKETAIFAVLIVIFGAIVLYLMAMHDDYLKKKEAATAAVTQLINEKQQIDSKFLAVQQSLEVYQESQDRIAKQGLFIDSQAVRDFFNNAQSRFHLKKVSVEMQPVTDMTGDAKYANKNYVVTRSNVKVTIEALTDEDIYNLIAAMHAELPGFVKITKITFNKKQELSKDILATVRREGTYSLIDISMTFDWFGLRSTEEGSKFNRYSRKKVSVEP